jgi:hypothetical protein
MHWSLPYPTLPCSLDVYNCSAANAAAAMAMLQQLPQLRGIRLGIHEYEGTEADYEYPYLEGVVEWVSLPTMAGLAALTALELVGAASLPPDWRQLSALQRLHVSVSKEFAANEHNADEEDWRFEWGSGPLTALTALTSLSIDDGSDYEALMPGEAVPVLSVGT